MCESIKCSFLCYIKFTAEDDEMTRVWLTQADIYILGEAHARQMKSSIDCASRAR